MTLPEPREFAWPDSPRPSLALAAPPIATLLEDAEEDLLAFYALPADHWTKLRSTNPLERFNREIGRRTDVRSRRRATPRPGT